MNAEAVLFLNCKPDLKPDFSFCRENATSNPGRNYSFIFLKINGLTLLNN